MKDRKIELIMIAAVIAFLFSLFDFTRCLMIYGVITNQYSLSYQIFVMLIPISFVICVIVKIAKWNLNFEDILWDVYTPLLCWAFIMAFALPCSLVFAGICNGIMTLDMFI